MGLMVLHELGRGPVPQAPLSGLSPTSRRSRRPRSSTRLRSTTDLHDDPAQQWRDPVAVFEHSHKAMGSSLHPLAGSMELDLGALLYAVRRLPDAISRARLVVMGQSAEVFAQRGFRPFSEWTEVSAPGRRRLVRRW